MRSARRAGLAALGFALSAFFLVLTFRNVSLAELGEALGGVSWRLAPLAVAIKLLGLGAVAKRSHALLTAAGPSAYSRVLRAALVAFVGNTLFPMRVGELLRIAYLSRYTSLPPSTCTAVFVVERLLDVTLLLLLCFALALGALLELPRGGALVWLGAVVLCASALVVTIARRPDDGARLLRRLLAPLPFVPGDLVLAVYGRFVRGLAALNRPAHAATALVLTVIYWAATVLSIQVWLHAFGLQLPWFAPLVVLVFLAFSEALPAAPGWIGTYHYFAAAALAVFGVPAPTAASFAIVLHAMATLPATLLGIATLVVDFVREDVRAWRLPGPRPQGGPLA
jgi:uncharacterized membrane protein YbhN (UPF0104 family)